METAKEFYLVLVRGIVFELKLTFYVSSPAQPGIVHVGLGYQKHDPYFTSPTVSAQIRNSNSQTWQSVHLFILYFAFCILHLRVLIT